MIAKKSVRPKKIILVFPKICELRERSSPLWQIYLFNRFFLAIFFSSLDSFVFLGSSFFAVCSLLLTLKIYILIQIQICRRVSDKKNSSGRFLETRLPFLAFNGLFLFLIRSLLALQALNWLVLYFQPLFWLLQCLILK